MSWSRLEAKLTALIVKHTPANFSQTATMMVKELTEEDHKELEEIEKEYGEQGANAWLVNLFTQTGQYKKSGDQVELLTNARQYQRREM